MWLMVLEFLCLNLFDKAIYEDWAKSTDFNGVDFNPASDIAIPIELTDWQMKLFLITDVLHRHIHLKKAEVTFRMQAKEDPQNLAGDILAINHLEDLSHAFRVMFWWLIRKQCPELNLYGIGVRNGFKVVRDKQKAVIEVMPVDKADFLKALNDPSAPPELKALGKTILDKLVSICKKKCDTCKSSDMCPVKEGGTS